MLLNLQRLGLLFDNENYINTANNMLDNMQVAVTNYPTSFARWAQALTAKVNTYAEIVVVGENAKKVAAQIQARYIPHKVIMAAKEANDNYPLLFGKDAEEGKTLIYLCQNYACQAPVETVDELMKMLNNS